MKTNYTLAALATAAGIALLGACNSSNNDVINNGAETVNIANVKSNHVAMAYAVYTDSLTTAQALQTAVNVFVASPTEENLNVAKAAYKATRAPYQQSEIMRFDTNITEGKELASDGGPASVDDWEGQVNAWPLDENHIVSIIAGMENINTALLLNNNMVNGDANVTTGVHAIEFMLWGEDTNGVGPGAGMRPAADYDTANCADALCQRRADYLTTATDLLVADLTEMQAEWSPTATTTTGTLAYNFMQSDDSASLNYMLGSIYTMATEELAGARMNAGFFANDPEESHDCFSDLSHVAIYYNFQGVKNAFYGEYENVSGASFGNLIKQSDEATYDNFDQALQAIEANMLDIYEAGERTENTVRFDQIIGQDTTGTERQIAKSAIGKLTMLKDNVEAVDQLLSLNAIDTAGGGDSD